MHTRQHSWKDILHTSFAFNNWWATQPSFSTVIIGQPPCINKQPRQNSLTVDLNISPKQWFWIPGQAGGSNFLCPTISIQILKAKKHLSVNGKVSSIKKNTIYFQTTPVPLQFSAETSTEEFLPVQSARGMVQGRVHFAPCLEQQAEPHPHLRSMPTACASTTAPQRAAEPSQVSQVVRGRALQV